MNKCRADFENQCSYRLNKKDEKILIKKATEYYDKPIAADVDKYSYINEVTARVAGIYENLHLLIDEPLDKNYNLIIETSDDEDKKKAKDVSDSEYENPSDNKISNEKRKQRIDEKLKESPENSSVEERSSDSEDENPCDNKISDEEKKRRIDEKFEQPSYEKGDFGDRDSNKVKKIVDKYYKNNDQRF